MLWTTNQLGNANPESVLNTLWFNNTVHFGLRGSDEHKQMRWGDVELKQDSSGLEFLEFTERVSKTRQGVDAKGVRSVSPKMWATPENKDRCPVELYKLYRGYRPVGFGLPDTAFYIASTTIKNPPIESQWFKRQPVGIHKLESMMKRMSKSAGLSQHKKLPGSILSKN